MRERLSSRPDVIIVNWGHVSKRWCCNFVCGQLHHPCNEKVNLMPSSRFYFKVIDGNLHLNVITPGIFEVNNEVKSLIEPYIFESVMKRGGSISAEHGLGQCKNNYLGKYAKSEEAVMIMKSIKNTFDPNGIMNPGKFLPSDTVPVPGK